jgi:hypothetical protein
MTGQPKRVRWECPTGAHPAVLGSTRPRRDDIVRYCLECSKVTGRLVERVAPVLERQRAAGAERSAAKAKAKRERDAAARDRKAAAQAERYMVDGVDLRQEFARLVRLRAFGGASGTMARRPPRFDISRRTSEPTRYGVAYPYENRIILATWPGITLADARESLVHELTHIAVGADRSDTRAWHGEKFADTMRRAFREAYKVDPIGVRHNRYHGRYAAALARQAKEDDQ